METHKVVGSTCGTVLSTAHQHPIHLIFVILEHPIFFIFLLSITFAVFFPVTTFHYLNQIQQQPHLSINEMVIFDSIVK